jgi:HEAT repeat protein
MPISISTKGIFNLMTDHLHHPTNPLHHPDRSSRSRAIFALAEGDDTNKLDILLMALCDEQDLLVGEDITWALVRMGDVAIDPLINLLHHTDPLVRHRAVHTLGKIGDARALDAVINATHDPDNKVVCKAVFVLGQLNDTRAIPALIRLLGHDNREVETMLMSVLEGFGAVALPHVIEAMRHDQWQVREHAADVLGVIGMEKALPVLILALTDTQWQVRFASVTALGHIGGIEAKEALLAMPTDSDSRVAELVIKTIKRMRVRRTRA